MKTPIKNLLFAAIMLLFSHVAFTQGDPNPQPSAFDWLDEPADNKSYVEGSPFAQGNWNFRLRNNIKYQSFTMEDESDNDFGVNLQTKYFVANGFGIGLSLGYDNASFKNDNYTDKTSGFDVMGGLTYGHSFGEFNLFVEGWAGIGKSTNTYTNTGSETEQKTDQLKYKVALGSPIQVGDRAVYVTPRFGYSFQKETYPDIDDFEYVRTRLFFDVKMDFYMGCGGMFCGYDEEGYDGRYDQGTNHLVVPSWGRFNIGDDILRYGGDGGSEFKNSATDIGFTISDYHYVVDNFALGLSASFRNNVAEQDDGGYKSTSFSYYVMPMLRFNLPVDGCFNNLFIEGGYGIGSNKITQESSGTSNDFKYDRTVIQAGIGYNLFIHQNFGFTFGAHYMDVTVKDDTDSELKTSRFTGSIGTIIRF